MVKTLDEGKKRYIAAMAKKYVNYPDGIAKFLGVDKAKIATAGPVVSYLDKFDTDEDRKARADAWEVGIKAAYGLLEVTAAAAA